MRTLSSVEEERIRLAYAVRSAKDPRYSMFSPSHLFRVQECEKEVLTLLTGAGMTDLGDARILEVGCGTGTWLRDFVRWGASPNNLFGIDLLSERVAQARLLCPAGTIIRQGSAAAVDLPDASFDIVLQSTVMTSVLDDRMRRQIASEMLRLVKQTGFILWYDFYVNNPRNPDVRAVRRTEIGQLFPNCRVSLRRVTLAPPLTRALAGRSWLATYALSHIPWLCTHYLGAIYPPGLPQMSAVA